MQRSKTLNASDIRLIETEAGTLPGTWRVDPVIDLKRPGKPRVWLRDDAGLMPSINFERSGGTMLVCCDDEGDHEASSMICAMFETIPAAFIYLARRLAAASPRCRGGRASGGNPRSLRPEQSTHGVGAGGERGRRQRR